MQQKSAWLDKSESLSCSPSPFCYIINGHFTKQPASWKVALNHGKKAIFSPQLVSLCPSNSPPTPAPQNKMPHFSSRYQYEFELQCDSIAERLIQFGHNQIGASECRETQHSFRRYQVVSDWHNGATEGTCSDGGITFEIWACVGGRGQWWGGSVLEGVPNQTRREKTQRETWRTSAHTACF